MTATDRVKTAVERNIKAISLRPSIGQGTAVTTVRIREGVTCDIEDGAWKLVGDESAGEGGAGAGPDPGVFGRAALGTCLAIGYAMWAAHMGVAFSKIEVAVHAGYDARGMYGVDDAVAPGWTSVRYVVHIESPAAEEDVRRVIDYADAHSPLLDDFRRPLPIERELHIAKAT
jgi:uncharacterized OsmC-like protein